ncbi:hypothetical protein [Herbiconiux sp. YIM B11900]|uniref:hypothetical protein n=1 Tax=Herbiconiux sp. YIM B11900 TaxID=3404131 RepID=UPI003F835A18
MNLPQINGGRGVALLVGGAYCFVRGIAYTPLGGPPGELPGGLALISSFASIEVWAGIWIIVGIGCILRAFSKADALAWGMLTGMMTAWGAAYTIGWFFDIAAGEPSRQWLSASTYLLPAVIIMILSARTRSRGKPTEPQE